MSTDEELLKYKRHKQTEKARIALETMPAKESEIVRALRRKMIRECEMCGVGGC